MKILSKYYQIVIANRIFFILLIIFVTFLFEGIFTEAINLLLTMICIHKHTLYSRNRIIAFIDQQFNLAFLFKLFKFTSATEKTRCLAVASPTFNPMDKD